MSFVKLRFAPSPTGYLHLGNVRTALINWLYARAHQGDFLLRLDDTDVQRSEERYAEQITHDLEWMGLTYDAQVRQSDRLSLYEVSAAHLKESGRLYPCYETAEELALQRKTLLSAGKPPLYNRGALSLNPSQIEAFAQEGRKPHWRFKMLPQEIHWEDLIRGPVTFQGERLGDPVLIREDGSPVFTFATAVDDREMGITHILRGEDHVSNTATQIQIMDALAGNSHPIHFGHLALISGAQGEGLSKREGSLSLKDLKAQGVEPMAINSILAKLGTSDPILPHTHLSEILDTFKIESFGRSTPKLDPEDLRLMNGKILQQTSFEDIKPRLQALGLLSPTPEFWTLAQQNIQKLEDVKEWWEICYGPQVYSEANTALLEAAETCLPPAPWEETTFKTWADQIKHATGLKGKDLFIPLRRALTGQTHGPELKDLILVMGRIQVLKRLQAARC